MSQAGYTATEALAGLLIIGLALGGLTKGLGVVGKIQIAAQANTNRAVSIRLADAALTRLLANEGPIHSDDPGYFRGSEQEFNFECNPSPCSSEIADGDLIVFRGRESEQRIPLHAFKNLHFVYNSDIGTSAAWPPKDLASSVNPVALRAVSLVNGIGSDSTTIVVARIWNQQLAGCEFDSISQECRR